MVEAVFERGKNAATAGSGLYQWDYGQELAFINAGLPSPVEVHFSVYGKPVKTMVGITYGEKTIVPIPDEFLTVGLAIVAYAFVSDEHSGATIRTATIPVTKRPKDDSYDPPTEAEETLFREAIRRVQAAQTAADAAASAAAGSAGAASGAKSGADAAKQAAETAASAAASSAQVAASAKSGANTAKQAAETAASGAAGSAQDAAAAKSGADTAKQAAETAASAAASSAQAAASAKSGADTAKQAAETAASGAAGSAQDAAAAKSGADTAKQAAETAASAAASSAQAAASAKSGADTAKQAAETAASGAAGSAQDAAAAKSGADTAKQAAETAASGAASSAQAAANAATSAKTAQSGAEKAQSWAKDYAADAAGSAGDAKDSADAAARYYESFVKSSELKTKIDALFRYPRTGKVYTVKIPKYAANQATTCEKLDDNAGLVCEPSTDTVEGRDDYADIPLFRWYNCNYLREESGHAYPTAIEGLDDAYTTEGNVDVGVIQMAPYIKWDESNEGYTLLSITDSPREGYTLWSTARYGDEAFPYVIHSKYFSSTGPDGMPRSLPGLVPRREQSHNSQIGDYGKKGTGYTGARAERNTWQIVFELIKYPHKSAQIVFAGCTSYSFQYSAAVQRTGNDTYFPVTKAQAANIIVGSRVSVGYGAITSGALTTDRGYDNIHKYADEAKVLRIEPIDDNISAVYLDVASGFPTAKVALSDSLTSDVYISSMHWHSGVTDAVLGHHDGTPVSNTDGKRPYRVQGVEYAVGGYFVASDAVFQFEDAVGTKFLRVCPDGVAHSSNEATIKAQYMEVGSIPAGDYWIGDISIDPDTCVSWPSAKGGGNAVGVGDYLYSGGTPAAGTLRELLIGGALWYGSNAGPSCASAGYWLGGGSWYFLAAD